MIPILSRRVFQLIFACVLFGAWILAFDLAHNNSPAWRWLAGVCASVNAALSTRHTSEDHGMLAPVLWWAAATVAAILVVLPLRRLTDLPSMASLSGGLYPPNPAQLLRAWAERRRYERTIAPLLQVLREAGFAVRGGSPYDKPWREGRYWVSLDPNGEAMRVSAWLHLAAHRRPRLPRGVHVHLDLSGEHGAVTQSVWFDDGADPGAEERIDQLMAVHRGVFASLTEPDFDMQDDVRPVMFNWTIARDDGEALMRGLAVVDALAVAL